MGQKSGVVERESELRGSDGAAVPAFVAEPPGVSAAPRVVIAPEIFGVSPWVSPVLGVYGNRDAGIPLADVEASARR